MITKCSASSQNPADSAPQFAWKDPSCTNRDLFDRVTLPSPIHHEPPLAKRRIKADRRLLSELGRMRKPSRRRSSHKEMGKRMFFLLSGRRHIPESAPASYQNALQLEMELYEIPLPVWQYRLPSFREGFSDWIPDTSHLKSIQAEPDVDRASGEKGNVVLPLPSILTLLKTESR